MLWFHNNVCNYGGALYSAASTINIINCTFNANYADYYGGGIFFWNTICELSNCIFWDNTAPQDAGPEIAIQGGSIVSINYCDIKGGQGDFLAGCFFDRYSRTTLGPENLIPANVRKFVILQDRETVRDKVRTHTAWSKSETMQYQQ